MRRKLAIGMAAPSLTAATADTCTRGTAAFACGIHVGHRLPVGHGDAR
ncbi:hypothetical protein [Actinoallomurus vinaceus]